MLIQEKLNAVLQIKISKIQRKPDLVTHITQKVEAGGTQVQGQPRLT